MKKNKALKFFTNRFAAARRKAASSKRLPSASILPAASEFEALENRILLSGIGTGLGQTRVQFLDADGDLVTVSARGQGASFDIFLSAGVADGADVELITIRGQGASLGVAVVPQGASLDFTPGFTTIGKISAAVDVTEINSIGLSAAIVTNIDLGKANVGNLSLSAGQVAKIDAITGSNNLPQIDFQNITVSSLGSLRLAGGDSVENNFEGNITLTKGGLGQIWAPYSMVTKDLRFEGSSALTSVNLYGSGFSPNSTIYAAGDFTFSANNFGASLQVGGHLNIGFNGGFSGNILGGQGISGLSPSTTDTITVNGGQFRGKIVALGNLSAMNFKDASLFGATIEASNIGTIDFSGAGFLNGTISAQTDIGGVVVSNRDLPLGAGGLVVSAGGRLGLIDVTNGNLTGALIAGSIGNVFVTGGDLRASLVASTGGIGNVTVELGRITSEGGLVAQGGGIGNVTVTADSWYPLGGIDGPIIAENGSIGKVDVSNIGSGPAIGNGAVISASNQIAQIDASTAGGEAIGYALITAKGTIGPVNAISYGYGGFGAINGLTLTGPSIGAITASSASGVGINFATFISTTGAIGSISGTGLTGGIINTNVTSAAGIGSITGTAIRSGDGIGWGVFETQGGSIGAITGKALTGTGINGSQIASLSGGIGNITGFSGSLSGGADGIANLSVVSVRGSVGNITGTSNGGWGDGLDSLLIKAATGIGTISGTASQNGMGIRGGVYDVNGPAAGIAGVVGSTHSGIGIGAAATFSAPGGAIGPISASASGPLGQAVNNATFTAVSLGNMDFKVANLFGGGAAVFRLNAAATGGSIGNITVTSDSVAAGGTGILESNFSAKTGNIGNITVSSTGDGNTAIRSSNFSADGGIGAITISAAGGNFARGLETSSFKADSDANGSGSISSVSVTSSGSGIFSTILHGASIGAITASAGSGGTIQSTNILATSGSIGAITASGIGAGITGLNATASSSIGSVTSSGTANGQSLTANAQAFGGATFTNLDNGATASIALGPSVTSVGNLSVDSPGAASNKANLVVTGGMLAVLGSVTADGNTDLSGLTALAPSSTVGNIAVGGQFSVGGVLSNAKTVGMVSVGSLASIGANTNIGVGGAGSSIGLVTVGANNAANEYQFRFATMNGVTIGATSVLVIPAGNVTASAASTVGGAISGGIRMIRA